MERLNKYINKQNKALLNSSYDMEGLFNIIHDQDDRIFGEYINNFSIESVKYTNFKSYCYKFAKYLSERIDDAKGSYIGIYLENSINFIGAFWALLMQGFKVALLNCRLPDEINQNIMDILNIKTIISCGSKLNTREIIIDKTPGLIKEVLECDEYKDAVWENYVALSSTATSKNYKVCIYSGKDLTYQILNAKSIILKNSMIKRHYKGRLKLLTFLPFYHIFGLIATYFWFSIFGRTFVFLTDYSSETILKTVQRHKVTHLFSVPLLWNTIVREIKKEVNLLSDKEKRKFEKGIKISLALQNIFPELGAKIARKMFKRITSLIFGDSIKFTISGGGYISDEALKLINGIGYPLFNGYGSTEIGITSVELRKKAKYRILGSVGKPFKSLEYQINGDVLEVRGKSTCSVIINKDKTETIINKDEYFNTSDDAKVDAKGYYYILGRLDDVYISPNGEKINPDLIEKKCLFTTISNYSILTIDNTLSFVFEVSDQTNALRIKHIYEEVEKTLCDLKKDGYLIEKIYYTNDKMTSPNAIKVSRKILKDDIAKGVIKLHPFSELNKYELLTEVEITNDIYQKVQKVFALVLSLNKGEVGLDKHFIFDLGGSSLDYFTLLIKMKNEFNIEFNFKDQSFSTVKEFGDYIISVMNKENE